MFAETSTSACRNRTFGNICPENSQFGQLPVGLIAQLVEYCYWLPEITLELTIPGSQFTEKIFYNLRSGTQINIDTHAKYRETEFR